jgi:NAD(P)-dependent dehydrogenase (short-subunit alcohol dehydrogenase family)
MFRAGLLDGRRMAVAGPAAGDAPAAEIDRAVCDRLRALGARLDAVDPGTLSDEAATAGWAEARAPLDGLVFLGAEPFGAGGADRLQATLEAAWRAVHGTQPHLSGCGGGRLVFVAPRTGSGHHDEAAQAGLENLARTLSVEWARFGVTAVAVAPGPATAPAEVADLVAYLLSDAGGYLSGCRFSLGTLTGTAGGDRSSA